VGVRAALCIVVMIATAPQLVAQRFRWWQDQDVQRALALSRRQVGALEHEFAQGLDQRRALREELVRADDEVERALARGDLSDEAAMVLIERAETLRYRRNVARTLMLARMYRLLTPVQRAELTRLLPRPRQ
jgi:Spy/CpxP family protein refolding chaperone